MVRTRKRKAEGAEGGMQAHSGLLKLYEACIANAEMLLEDARLLLENRRVARAFALAFTAYEEVGKSQVVADAYSGLVAASELSEAFRRHDLKEDFGVDYAPTTPVEAITRQRAEEMIELVERELQAIAWAEELNGRIGTKSLWK